MTKPGTFRIPARGRAAKGPLSTCPQKSVGRFPAHGPAMRSSAPRRSHSSRPAREVAGRCTQHRSPIDGPRYPARRSPQPKLPRVLALREDSRKQSISGRRRGSRRSGLSRPERDRDDVLALLRARHEASPSTRDAIAARHRTARSDMDAVLDGPTPSVDARGGAPIGSPTFPRHFPRRFARGDERRTSDRPGSRASISVDDVRGRQLRHSATSLLFVALVGAGHGGERAAHVVPRFGRPACAHERSITRDERGA